MCFIEMPSLQIKIFFQRKCPINALCDTKYVFGSVDDGVGLQFLFLNFLVKKTHKMYIADIHPKIGKKRRKNNL